MTDNRPICGEAPKTTSDEGQKLLAKVTDRRKKNNESKRKSTAKKRAGEEADHAELASLEERNAVLKAKAQDIQSEVDRLKELILGAIPKKKCKRCGKV